MIDINIIRFNGKLNFQDGLCFYFTNGMHTVSFLIQEIGDRKRKIKVSMHPDFNHGRPHVHINGHDASIAIDNGELLAGDCETRSLKIVQEWIKKHRSNLQVLWNVAKNGKDYRPLVNAVQHDITFNSFGFNGTEPGNHDIVDGVMIWYDGELELKIDEKEDVKYATTKGDMYVGLPVNYKGGKIKFNSVNGNVRYGSAKY